MNRLALLVLSCALGCTPPSESRADADALVGKAGIAGVEVEVAEGLASVRLLEEGRLHLWCGAPEPSLRLALDAGGSWEIAIDNAMPDAALVVTSESGETIEPDNLPMSLDARPPASVRAATTNVYAELPFRDAKAKALASFEAAYFREVLGRADGNVSEAARRAGLDRSNFRRLLKQFAVQPKRSGQAEAVASMPAEMDDPEDALDVA